MKDISNGQFNERVSQISYALTTCELVPDIDQ